MEYAQPMKVGSLFSGIGGLDLGLERACMDVIWQSEIDPYACKVLDKHWPTVPNLGNIKEIDWSQVERPDVICGGYPCQPFSTAGKRQGEGDARHLWPWVRECIAELRPRYAVLENVRGHLSLGFGTVLGDLAAIGYDTEWQVISAASIGAPHRRDRVFIVAYPNNSRIRTSRNGINYNGSKEIKKQQHIAQHGASGCSTELAYTNGEQLGQRRFEEHTQPKGVVGRHNQRGEADDVIGQWWAIEPNVGRVAHGIPNRVDRLRCLGNAVVPQVAEYVGRLIMAAQ